MQDVLTRIGQCRIIPVIALDDADAAVPLADALVAGGLPIIEITFRTDAAERAIRAVAQRGDLLVGAGTVLNVDTAKKARDAGARFIVSPGFNPKVVSWCVAAGIPITPGVATPTDIEMALDHGLGVMKFFPAEPLGGIAMLKAVAAPYGMMRFIPTGGIGPENIGEYLAFPKVLACGGSWMATKELIAAGQFDKIRDLARQAVEVAGRATEK
ncbi:MAG TPA: bifunctional 4-hydroxy-2-oxoglutarate aldolase/2-dehydro-3-deoxy-phosphogluconate aldolase [Tepidisphaeraceae bacterium]|jgi:2-dehydro-3-deoxyphosphogluconate aldolase/(4S)-4-hydroxy-2-oxoglutarate aldolase|nr:bifunctional 4-hydroxy-2-oxoglutarate aldolase/2-dehydro-3-deoxy-phosphogluconate aldolase [Tepidisphaeraceae bacterium]